jgi:hypothetical protein
MAKFEQGNPIGEATRISGDVAGEMQARSVESRRRNKTLRETLLAALMEDGGGGKTRLEHLVLKAMDNHRKGRLTFHDLKDLAFVLGEAELGITGGDGGDLGIRIVDTRKVHRSPLIIDETPEGEAVEHE